MPGETSRQIKILIVDDDRDIADILVDIVSNKERTVDVCYNGVDAVKSIRNSIYDLFIVDLIMPGVGGLDVLKYAKKSNPDALVIIITGYASLETAVAAIKEGAYDYIRKPWKLEEIKVVVANAVDKIKLHRENSELLKRLRDAYRELVVLKAKKNEEDKIEKINFFSSKMPNLHYLYNHSSPSSSYVDELQALSSLRDSGTLTASEFKAFKSHLLKMII